MCPLVQASFVSRKVCKLVSADPTIAVLRVVPNEACDAFELIQNLWNGECIDVSKDDAESLAKLSCELENEDLNSLLLVSEELSVENSISRLRLKADLCQDASEELEFLNCNLHILESVIWKAFWLVKV